jgi:DNA-directed RNA polymerase subunit RPC12/RpoP
MKVAKSTHKGQQVYICTGCGTVAENLNPTNYFPQGYHYDTCLNCKQDLDYNQPKVFEKTIFTKADLEVIAKWAKEKFKS